MSEALAEAKQSATDCTSLREAAEGAEQALARAISDKESLRQQLRLESKSCGELRTLLKQSDEKLESTLSQLREVQAVRLNI